MLRVKEKREGHKFENRFKKLFWRMGEEFDEGKH